MRPHRRQPTRPLHPWDSLGKNTGVGCHFLLQCMKVKSESEVAQSCLTLSDPMDYSPPGSSIHGIFQARVLEWVAILNPNQPTNNVLHDVGDRIVHKALVFCQQRNQTRIKGGRKEEEMFLLFACYSCQCHPSTTILPCQLQLLSGYAFFMHSQN